MSQPITRKIIYIERKIHGPTGLRVAYSEDLKGLHVFGDTDEEINAKLPGAIREMLEAIGHNVISVEPEPDAGWSDSSRKAMQIEVSEAA